MNDRIRDARGTPGHGFTLIEMIVTIGVIAALVGGASYILSGEIGYFTVRADAMRLVQAVRAEQAKAQRTGHPGWIVFFRGRVMPNKDSASPAFVIEPAGYSCLPSTGSATHPTVDPGEIAPSAFALSELTDDERAAVVNFDRGTQLLYQGGQPMAGGDIVRFASFESTSGTDPAAIVRRGARWDRPSDPAPSLPAFRVHTDTYDQDFQVNVDPGGYVFLSLP